MYQFGIDSKTIDFIIDDNPLKQGKFTPGLKIPVLPSTSIKEKTRLFINLSFGTLLSQ